MLYDSAGHPISILSIIVKPKPSYLLVNREALEVLNSVSGFLV